MARACTAHEAGQVRGCGEARARCACVVSATLGGRYPRSGGILHGSSGAPAGRGLSPPHLGVDTPEVGVSSTEVRRRRRAGAPVRYLVPDAVAAYIAQHAL